MTTVMRYLCEPLNIRPGLLVGIIFFMAFTCTEGVAQPPGTDGTIDACSLLTKEEVEAATGRKVLAPMKANMANLATCYYGNPESPVINNRPLDSIVKVGLMVGIEGQYYAGPVAQARDTYEMARKNAASAQTVDKLGDGAYWDETFKTLNVLQGKYLLDISVSSEAGGLDVATGIATTILRRLP